MSDLELMREQRIFTAYCSKRLGESCVGQQSVVRDSNLPESLDGPTTVTTATGHFRGIGWRFHQYGTATCPACLSLWALGRDVQEDEAQTAPVLASDMLVSE
jgi:hypothetical protein